MTENLAKRRKPARRIRAPGSRIRTSKKRVAARAKPTRPTRRATASPSLRKTPRRSPARSSTRTKTRSVAPARLPTAAERARQKIAIEFAKRLKERQRKTKRLTRTREFEDIQYGARLKTVQRYVDGFDTQKFADLLQHTPRSAKGKADRRKLRAKVNRTWQILHPFLARSQKTVRIRSKKSAEALRKYAAFPKLKGLKAIPISTAAPEKTRIRVDRKGRVELSIGKRYREKLFLFPSAPIDPDDMLDMAEEMIPSLPMGYYLIVTTHHDLLPTVAHRNQLLDELRMLVYQYRDEVGFLAMVRGFKWLGHTRDAAQKYSSSMSAARRNAFMERRNAFDEVRRLATARRKQKRLSKRARVTGKG